MYVCYYYNVYMIYRNIYIYVYTVMCLNISATCTLNSGKYHEKHLIHYNHKTITIKMVIIMIVLMMMIIIIVCFYDGWALTEND